ncbi:DUF6694 family lipoprotein [Vibrio cyclitrophicus]
MKFKMLSVGILATMLTGCGGTKLDGSSWDAVKISVNKIRSELNSEEREIFMDSIELVRRKCRKTVSGNINPICDGKEFLDFVDKKTASEMVDFYTEVRKTLK